jgi:hypothetical protein
MCRGKDVALPWFDAAGDEEHASARMIAQQATKAILAAARRYRGIDFSPKKNWCRYASSGTVHARSRGGGENDVKIVKSILGVVIGAVVAMISIMALQMISFAVSRPDDGKSFMEQMEAAQKDKEYAKSLMSAAPTAGLVIVLVAWQTGAFIGGATSALIAGRARLIHAAIIGAIILGGTILNGFAMKKDYDYTHPDWVIVLGLLLPIPASLLAGKFVAWLFPTPPPPVTPS